MWDAVLVRFENKGTGQRHGTPGAGAGDAGRVGR